MFDRMHCSMRSEMPRLPVAVWQGGNPERILHTSSAADALSHVIVPFRRGDTTAMRALRSLFEMLDRRSPSDVVRGLAMLRGLSYKGAPIDRKNVKTSSDHPISTHVASFESSSSSPSHKHPPGNV
jgi:hypothetical protein